MQRISQKRSSLGAFLRRQQQRQSSIPSKMSKSIAEISWPETPLLKLLLLLYVAYCKSIKLHIRRKQRRLGIASLPLPLSPLPLPTSRHFQFVIGHPSEGFDYCSKIFDFSDCLWFALLLCSRVRPPAFRQIQHNPHVTHTRPLGDVEHIVPGHCDKLPTPPACWLHCPASATTTVTATGGVQPLNDYKVATSATVAQNHSISVRAHALHTRSCAPLPLLCYFCVCYVCAS